jgi:hypothetical protein
MAKRNEVLPGLGTQSLVPKLGAGASLARLELTESEGYLLSRVDGRTSLWEICLLSPLKREQTLDVLRKLRASGVIEIPGSTEPMPELPPPPPAAVPAPPPPATPPVQPPAPSRGSPLVLSLETPRPAPHAPAEPDLTDVQVLKRASGASGFPNPMPNPMIDDTRPSRQSHVSSQRSSASGPQARTAAPAAASQPGPPSVTSRPAAIRPVPPGGDSEACDLTPEQRQRIDELYAMINVADAFSLLGLTPRDGEDRRAVQRAYVKLTKEFHPDRFFKRQLGPYRPRIAAVFQAITEARDILIDDERRRRYLAGEVP